MKLFVKHEAAGVSVGTDGSVWISGALPRLYWRTVGAVDWVESAGEIIGGAKSEEGRIEIRSRFAQVAELTLEIRRGDEATWIASASLRSISAEPIELARCHLLHGKRGVPAGLLAPTPHIDSAKWFAPGTKLGPMKSGMEDCWGAMGVTWGRLADPIHMRPNWSLSIDTGVLTTGWNAPGLHFGFTSPVSAFGEIGVETVGETPHVFAGLLLDGVRFEPGETRTLDRLRLRAGDWQESMQLWANTCASEIGARKIQPPLTGYCSWYQFYVDVKAADIERASHEFADWPTPPGGRTVQIDDGFQIMPGDWRPNDRFAEKWQSLPKEIEKNGSVPGLWLAPHAIFHRHPICTEHPEWLQRRADGTPAVSFSNWGWCADASVRKEGQPEPTHYLDPDHPGAREFMAEIIRDAVRAGWKYLKIDFAYAVSTARKSWNPHHTRMETLRGLFQLFREAAGPNTLICACIGEMGRFALGHADTARLGGDIGANWNLISRNLPDLLVRLSTNGTWWNADPDVFMMRNENSDAKTNEAWCLTGTIGMIGGVFLTSDFASQWTPEAVEMVKAFWNSDGPQIPSSFRVAYSAEGIPLAIRFTYNDPKECCVLAYNWKDQPDSLRLDLSSLGLSAGDSLRVKKGPANGEVKLGKDELAIQQMPARSLSIIRLRNE